MPLTLPAHAAAALPLYAIGRGFLHPTALVMGCCAPDLAYVFDLHGFDSHNTVALFTICLPIGLAATVWAEALVLPFLARITPAMLGVDWPRLFTTGGVPLGLVSIAGAVVSVLLGSISHMLWDGLAHPAWWPACVLYPGVTLDIMGREVELAYFIWVASTILGTMVIYTYMLMRFRGPVAIRGGSLLWSGVLVAAMVLSVFLAAAVHYRDWFGSVLRWNTYVAAATYGLIAVSVLSAVHRLSAGGAVSGPGAGSSTQTDRVSGRGANK
jgi:hypothetical protein